MDFSPILPQDESAAADLLERVVGDRLRLEIIDNYVSDIVDGVGMILCSTTAHAEQNQCKKNIKGGMLITSGSVPELSADFKVIN
jgi:hypothetical protein